MPHPFSDRLLPARFPTLSVKNAWGDLCIHTIQKGIFNAKLKTTYFDAKLVKQIVEEVLHTLQQSNISLCPRDFRKNDPSQRLLFFILYPVNMLPDFDNCLNTKDEYEPNVSL